MVPPPFPHKQYVRFVPNKAAGCGGLRTSHRHFDVWRKLKATNLDSAYPVLAGLYSSDWGCIARHPPRQVGRVVVRDRNAHAWVELWMPTQGWVRFDPTPRGDGVNPTTFGLAEEELGFALTDYLNVPAPEPLSFEGAPLRPPEFGEDDFPIFSGGDAGESAGGGLEIPGWLKMVTPIVVLTLLLVGAVPAIISEKKIMLW